MTQRAMPAGRLETRGAANLPGFGRARRKTVQLAPAESARIRPPAAMYTVLCAQAACLGDVCSFLRLMTTCCAARCRVWMQRARAVRQEVEAYANFILATRLWLPGFLAHDVIDVRVSWNAPEWIHAQIRLPTFFDNSFRCADEAIMQQWIDQHPRLRGLPPLAALHRMNCLDNMAPNEFDAFLCALRSGSARFMYTPAVEGSEPDSPVFGPALITLLCCESLPLALCARRVGCLQQHKLPRLDRSAFASTNRLACCGCAQCHASIPAALSCDSAVSPICAAHGRKNEHACWPCLCAFFLLGAACVSTPTHVSSSL